MTTSSKASSKAPALKEILNIDSTSNSSEQDTSNEQVDNEAMDTGKYYVNVSIYQKSVLTSNSILVMVFKSS